MLIVMIVVGEPHQMALAERQVVEFVLEDDTSMEEPVLYDAVAGSLLLVGERYLGQIVFAFVGIVCEAVGGRGFCNL